jgi:hypothetical protein
LPKLIEVMASSWTPPTSASPVKGAASTDRVCGGSESVVPVKATVKVLLLSAVPPLGKPTAATGGEKWMVIGTEPLPLIPK